MSLLLSWTGCIGSPDVKSVVVPDSKDLRPAYTCQENADGSVYGCARDLGRATVDLGYLREIIDLLDACEKRTVHLENLEDGTNVYSYPCGDKMCYTIDNQAAL